MTSTTIGALTPGQQKVDAVSAATPEQIQVARDFEAIFMRQLLSSMEKGAGLGGSDSGARVYGSMLVGALADTAAAGGGIGLSDLVLEAMLRASGGAGNAKPVDAKPVDAKPVDASARDSAPGVGESGFLGDESSLSHDGATPSR